MSFWAALILLAPAAVVAYLSVRAARRAEFASREVLAENESAGLTEPSSLHPAIDEAQCIGCGACVDACPEGEILGLIGNKAKLIHPTKCIGHGACARACPTQAIELVFGTARRGVEIPHVKPDFETNVPGLFIAGELGGMGLIRNAIEQGRQAMESIARRRALDDSMLDVLIVGAGPAGLAATLGAHEQGLRYETVEQDSLGGTVYNFPRGKLVMTQTAQLPIVGKMRFRETTKEELLRFWRDVEKKTRVQIRYRERMESIAVGDDAHEVRTTKGTYRARNVLLAIGRRGTPRRLDVPGEETSKVVYKLSDAAEYRGKRVLVVGGGDSALEAALSIAEERGTTVHLSYRSAAFGRAKPKNRERIAAAADAGRVTLLLSTEVARIEPERVELTGESGPIELPNDAVLVCIGGQVPTPLLRALGVTIETKYGAA